MTSGNQEQFTKPRRHIFMYVVIAFVLIVIAWFAVIVLQGPSTDQEVIESIGDQYSSASTQSGGGAADVNEQVSVVTSDDPYFGDPNAEVQIVEFGDFECPYCAQALASVKALESAFGDRIFFQFRDFPIVDIHDQALNAALAGECAHDQGNDAFWAYHDRLYQFQEDLSDEVYIPIAERTGLDVDRFTLCFQEKTHLQEIQTDFDSGVFAGVSGTPTFFINGYRVTGVVPPETFVEIVTTLLEN